ncbi:MAG: Na+/H+ antiporter subunit E [Clostridium sp.]|nr:Na+/H+ antiporter subunit E [Lachnoclostridium sp.]MCM1254092.1 Na+/H+ antiporter subunit E [Clostridium sp.]
MYLLYFLLWVIFNGNFTLEIAVFGVIIAAALFAFTCKFTDYSVAKEKKLMRNIFHLLHYVVVLVIEIVKANFAVIHLILSEEEEVEPALVTFQADLHTSMGRAALANAITLTPGTITVLLDDNSYTVHCLDETLAEGIDKSVFVDMIKKCE